MNHVIGRINPIFEWIINLATLNVFWVLFNFPIVYLCLLLFFVKTSSQIMFILSMILVLLPIFFFPATSALFGVVRKWILKKEIKIFRAFLSFYKENYKQSFLGGLLITFLWGIGVVDFFIFKENHIVKILFFLLLVFIFLFTLYFFANIVHTEGKLFQGMKNILILILSNPIYSLGIAIINFFLIYISIKYMTFLLPFFTGSLVAFVSFFGYLKVFNGILQIQNNQK